MKAKLWEDFAGGEGELRAGFVRCLRYLSSPCPGAAAEKSFPFCANVSLPTKISNGDA